MNQQADEGSVIATPADGVSILAVDGDAVEALERLVLDEHGRQTPQPAATYAACSPMVIAGLCVRNGIYGLVTIELVECVSALIAGRRAIEIGAGDGVLAKALGIQAVDNYMQEWEHVRATYNNWQQPPVKYGPNVERLDGADAVSKYAPEVIVACWLTHRWRPHFHEHGGNMYAPDEDYLVRNCQQLIFIGNDSAHKGHGLVRNEPHLHFHYDWLYSRAWRGRNFIGVWQGGKHER